MRAGSETAPRADASHRLSSRVLLIQCLHQIGILGGPAKTSQRPMKAGIRPGRAGSLVIELAARTAIVDGERVKMPPTEFTLLSILAARPGKVVSHRELLLETFGDSAHMAPQDLHWWMWKLRKLIGDQSREEKIVGNRRGVGYVLDLPPGVVKIIDTVAVPSTETLHHVIRLDHSPTGSDEASSQAPEAPPDISEESETLAITEKKDPDPARLRIAPRKALIALLIATVSLGGSWLAGYRLSQSAASAPDGLRTESENLPHGETTEAPNHDEPPAKPDGGRKGGKDSDGGTQGIPGTTSGDSPTTTAAPDGESPKPAEEKPEKKPPPPQPDAQLFHLHNPDSGDRYMTTSSSVANQKQASGYVLSVEGSLFTAKIPGTVAITLDDGSGYVYRNSGAAPSGVSVSELYRLVRDGDYFYTRSASIANQAVAGGWSRTVAGFVQ